MTQKHNITFGDLVHVDGYDDRPFFVDSWVIETHYTPDAEWSEVWFDVTCAWTGEYHMAELDDIMRICGAEQADDYLMYYAPNPPIQPEIKPDIGKLISEGFERGVLEMRKPERQPTQRELSSMEAERRKKARKERKEKIDALLDEYNDYKRLADEFGDEEYKARVEYISGKLAELAEEGRR